MTSKLEHPLEMLSTEEISLAYEIYKHQRVMMKQLILVRFFSGASKSFKRF